MLGGYYLGQLYLGESGLPSTGQLVVQDTHHSHTADNVTLIQHFTLVISDTVHGHTVDNVDLTEHKTLVVQDTTHAHTVDNVDITQQHLLVVQDTLHGQTVDSLTLTQGHILAIADTLHSQTADSPTLSQAMTLIISDSLHSVTSDVVVLVEHKTLQINDTRHRIRSDVANIFNWDELGVFFGRYLDDYKKFGTLTAEQMAELGFLYNKFVASKAPFSEFEGEFGNFLVSLRNSGSLTEAEDFPAGSLVVDFYTIGSLESDKIRTELMFEDGFVWLSEDEQFVIVQEYNDKDKIETVSETGTFKQGIIEHGDLQEAV